MTDTNIDRHHAPQGRVKNKTQIALIGGLTAALIALAYLLLSPSARGDGEQTRKAEQHRLHTGSDAFKMPTFEKPERKPEPIPEPIATPEPMLIPEPLPEPQSILSIPEPLPQPQSLTVVAKEKKVAVNKPLSDLDRRLMGSVSGTQGVSPSFGGGDTSKDTKAEEKLAYLQPEPAYPPSSSAVLRAPASYPVTEKKPLSQEPSYASLGERRETRTRSSGSGGGIDLSSTVVASTQAKTIDLEYLLKRGTYIGCVLKTRIVSDQAGFISCSITEDIYSADGTRLLLPRGSEVLGEYKPKTLSVGKSRLHAVWDAVTTPSGIRVNLGSPLVGRLGASGLSGDVDNHWGQKVGIPILLSLFKTSVEYNTRQYTGETGAYAETGRGYFDDALDGQIRQYEKIQPTLTKNNGETIGILVARDVSFKNVLKGTE